MRKSILLLPLLSCSSLHDHSDSTVRQAEAGTSWSDLVKLHSEWRAFEEPPILNGAPDYTAERMEEALQELEVFRARLTAFDSSGWPLEHQSDLEIVRAEMNGFEFHARILQPWVRDPAFYQTVWTYQSDTPAHEGPTNHATLELWMYDWPLSDEASRKMEQELRVIPPLLEQARGNLTGDAGELFRAGIRNLQGQSRDLQVLREGLGTSVQASLLAALDDALVATKSFVAWLEEEAPGRTGPSGIGKENYTWYLQNVHLVPLTWEDEVRLLQRELDRAWSNLKLEEHRNRQLPQLLAAASPGEYNALADEGARRLMRFVDEEEIVTVTPNMEPALRAKLGSFRPEEERNFFWIGAHLDPVPLYTHFYHWWDLARMRDDPHPSPIRREPLLYNIWDSRAEGVATGVEEMFLHAGLYDDSPRSREIVWIMLAQRAARGLGSLYAHANEMTMEDAGRIHVRWTPRGWMTTEPELLVFEQHLYLRQPGYGTSYVTGKYMLEALLADYAEQKEARGEPFVLREFFDELNDCGLIPLALIHREMLERQEETAPGS